MPAFSKDDKIADQVTFYWTSESDFEIDEANSKLRKLFEQLCRRWKISTPPRAILSIIDGSKETHLKEKYVRILKKGFVNAARSTGAWIFTNGKKFCIVKLIGEALMEDKIKINEHEENVNRGNGSSKNDRQSESKLRVIGFSNVQDKENLDENHNHVKANILNPTGAETIKSSVARHLKWEFDKFMSKQEWTTIDGKPFKSIPVVRVMFEGNIESLKDMVLSVKENIPVLVLKGSGGASDFIGRAHEYFSNSAYSRDIELKELAAEHFGISEKEMDETLFTDLLAVLSSKDNMVFVYSIDDKKTSLDRYLHEIMFHEFKKSDLAISEQLRFVQEWNRCDIAEEGIFTLANQRKLDEMKKDNPEIFDELLKQALIKDMTEFAILYLDHVTDIQRFVVEKNLMDLFIECIKVGTDGHLFDLHLKTKGLDTTSLTLAEIGRGIEQLFQNGSFNPFINYEKKNTGYEDTNSKAYNQLTRPNKTKSQSLTTDAEAYRNLFIWALVFNRKDLARAFWERTSDNICSALYASSLLNALAEVASSEGNIELSLSYMEDSRYFEQLSCEVMSELYHTNPPAAHQIISKKIDLYGSTTNLDLAETNLLMEFMEHTACQSRINIIWKGNIAPYTPLWKILVTCALPILIVFRSLITIHGNETYETDLPWKHFVAKLNDVYLFFNAPIVKFIYHLFLYLVFLVIFSIFVLSDLYSLPNGGPTSLEGFTWFWISTMACEEIRQIHSIEHDTLPKKLKSWFANVWNKFDLLTYTIFYSTVVLRLALRNDNFYYARMFYAITLAMFFLRSLQFFLAAKYFGPKVIMLGRMATDTIFFILIFTVFVFSFGIIYQSTIFPNTPISFQLLKDIVYLPYWQLYGELFIDHIEGKEPSECTTNPALFRNNTRPRCAEYHPGNAVFLAVYLVITNVLLLNVLIAMFSNTFNKVQENSALVWKFYRYGLVQEYCGRPMLAPPLIILSHIYRLSRFLLYKCLTPSQVVSNEDVQKRTPNRLEIIEKEAVDNYENATFHRYKIRSDMDIGDRKTRYKQEYELSVREHLKLLSEEVKGIHKRLEKLCEDTTILKKEKQNLLVVDVPRHEPVHVTNFQKTKRQEEESQLQ